MDGSESPPFAAVLHRYRLAAGLSQERLAERAGLSARGLSDLERGVRQTPRLETVRRLADALALAGPDRTALLRAARRDGSPPPADASPGLGRLPVPPTALIGRDREVADLAALLRDPAARLVTLTGPGGVGKSRLALEVATVTAPAYPHGAHLVELAPLRDPALVLPAIARVLEVPQAGGTPVARLLERYLRDRRLLLLLDNVEHLLPAAPDVARLLAASRHLTVLATSRTPLALRGEQQVAVAPLPFPVNGAIASAETVGATPAGQLFVARARQVRPGFALQDADAPAVAAICQRLDGLPLALELAAAHVKTLPPTALLARLERRLPMLTRGPRDLPERHRALDATIAWSYNLLPPGDQRLFRRLSVFAGGWTIDAATAIIADTGVDALDGLLPLVNASVIVPAEGASPEPRFIMLETVREFAAERLAESGEADRARGAHAAWVLALVERGGPELVGPNQPHWLARFDEEHDNLRAALGWALARDDVELAARLSTAAWQYWLTRANAPEGRRWLDRVLAGADRLPIALRGGARFAAGTLAAAQDDYAVAEPLLEDAVAALRAVGARPPLARALQTLGIIALNRDEPTRAVPLLEEALATYEQPIHPFFGPWYALVHSQLGAAVSALGDHDRAARLATQGITLQRQVGSELGVAIAMVYEGDIALDRGDAATARARYRYGIAALPPLGDRWYVVTMVTCWIIAAAATLPPRQAARLLGANAAIRDQLATPVWPRYAGPLAAAEARVRARLGEAAFTRAWDAGAALDLDATVAEILAIDAG